MYEIFKKVNLLFVYELVILGVIYFALITFQVMTKNFNGKLILLGLIILYLGQLVYFGRKRK
ncbi:hypothetical protein COSHB9_05520 [Companilactobacillus alimentarius]|uniref:Uncharacterized protein n=1 Tax=Companilactobacillus alimentarius DSM 20249 TaxID=1423720 RepID=A0A2K9HE83_9LACO|nr:hypothetical protein [Companilactobacillus alimentarius]AUI70864.1 hypothetical protein LA20249_01020 [Companilactobacillus alimentarius DSM 20249]KRK74971.1 hypothetical protein FC67_GL001477 [Companilactobacillus alimentarius DSM 20249]MDT6951946.1 hypothetical protein [Companilactobacillus alimentarius]GEO44260.1 hypothetical protein LAL01_04920 [Companilactobacillus alimentarius]